MRLGIVGVGRIGRMHAAHAVACVRVSRVTLLDTAPRRAAALAAELGVAVAPDLDALLGEVDALLVATPTPDHVATVRAGFAAGVHVLCEKPLTPDPALLTALAAETPPGLHLVVGFQRRFDPAYTALRAAIAAGELGRVYVLRAAAFDHVPPDPAYVATSGGIFLDQFVHDLDALPWLLGERAESVQATGSVLVDPAFAAAATWTPRWPRCASRAARSA